jgi:hypothetical protein
VVVNQIKGTVILPLVMARHVDFHPAPVAVGLLVIAQLFGIIRVLPAIALLSLTVSVIVEEVGTRVASVGATRDHSADPALTWECPADVAARAAEPTGAPDYCFASVTSSSAHAAGVPQRRMTGVCC